MNIAAGIADETPMRVLIVDDQPIIAEAVRRMLPKSRLGRVMFDKLKVYAGTEHPHQAQQPESLEAGVK